MTCYFCLDAPGYLPYPRSLLVTYLWNKKIAHYLAPSRCALGLTLFDAGGQEPRCVLVCNRKLHRSVG